MNLLWQDQAACKDKDPSIFFPDGRGGHIEAENICEKCPVRLDCLVYAIENKIDDGIWGGYGERARQRIKKRGRFVA